MRRTKLTLLVLAACAATSTSGELTAPTAICSPAWGSGAVPQICISTPAAQQASENAAPFGAQQTRPSAR